ncbi:hypothetical protein EV651_101175 [Kribbella sp. VKM Ac-2571]|uniref:hypothetical protein n=1 Tax=Kribbella sp. VKM Ac-2571 TaxID=2512222 RepID=UPI0010DB9E33|nr:hypothetical protein [Kribbella sp. VKM Ac-2571]TDO69136.1 hypothetical protein EV651_101175 [Kribbella sp. VKM Ac-2571]
MSDPTNPAGPENRTDDAGADTTELAPVPPVDPKPAEPTAAEPKAAEAKAAGGTAVAAKDGSAGAEPKKKLLRRFKVRGPWVTVGSAVVVLIVLALLGYVWGLGPLSRLNAERAITPPANVAGLDRITDPEIRSQAQLDQTRDALSRINDGKKVMVEAYGSLEGDRFYVLIALRGRVDIDKVVADSGASADKVKKIGNSTCIEAAGNLPTQCYRGSNTLTVIAQSANEGVAVDQVEPIAEQAFKAMR